MSSIFRQVFAIKKAYRTLTAKLQIEKIKKDGFSTILHELVVCIIFNIFISPRLSIIWNYRKNTAEGKSTGRKKKQEEIINVSDDQLESLARALLPAIRSYLLSEKGKKDYAEWKAKRAAQEESRSKSKLKKGLNKKEKKNKVTA